MNYDTELLNISHLKQQFNCGVILLDNYLHKQANQDIKRKLAACFVLADNDKSVKGYYTLSNTSIERTLLPETIIKKLPPTYLHLPATLLGRLAVGSEFKGQKLGAFLLVDALKRSYDTSIKSIGSMAVIVDPIDLNAIQFYKKYGFIFLEDSGKMFLPMQTIAMLFK